MRKSYILGVRAAASFPKTHGKGRWATPPPFPNGFGEAVVRLDPKSRRFPVRLLKIKDFGHLGTRHLLDVVLPRAEMLPLFSQRPEVKTVSLRLEFCFKVVL